LTVFTIYGLGNLVIASVLRIIITFSLNTGTCETLVFYWMTMFYLRGNCCLPASLID